MKFLGNRGYLLHKSLDAGLTGTGAALGGLNRGGSNAPGGVSGLITRHTRETVGSKSTQVGLSKGPGARARMFGDMTKVHTF
jgi:hypothetical protein